MMWDGEHDQKPDKVEEGIKDMKIKSEDSSGDEEASGTIRVGEIEQSSTHTSGNSSPTKMEDKSTTQSPKKRPSTSNSPIKGKGEDEQILGGGITLKLEPGQPPKLSRTASQKVVARAPQTFDHYEDKTQEATGVFQVITECSYSAKYLGSTEHAMECDCAEEWGKHDYSPDVARQYTLQVDTKMLIQMP